MIALLLALGCGSPDASSGLAGAPDTTTPQPTSPPVTTDLTEEADAPAVLLEQAATATVRVNFTGARAACDGDQVELLTEFVGPGYDPVVTPWWGEEAGGALSLDYSAEGVFHLATGTATVPDCEAATWVWEVAHEGGVRCLVSGPDAEGVAQVLAQGCQLL